MSRTRKRLIGAVVIVAIGAAATLALASRSKNGEAVGNGTPVAVAEVADIQVEVLDVGTVEPAVRVEVKSVLSGKVVELPIREGDAVRRGQLLAVIEPDVNQAQTLAGVRRSVNQATIDYTDADKDFQARAALFREGLLSAELFRAAETAYRTAEERLSAAREKAQIMEASGIPVGNNLGQVVQITAPMDGVVIRRPVELGETVTGAGSFNAGTVIATVADLATMIIKAGVNEVDIGKVAVAAPVTVTLDAYPRLRFSGRVERIAPAARLEDQVKVFDVEIELDSQGKELRTGMTANVTILGERTEDAVTVPVESVFRRESGELVYVKRASGNGANGQQPDPGDVSDPRQAWKQHFEERAVVTGLASMTRVEVVEGLAAGEEVALEDPSRPRNNGRTNVN